MGVDLHGFYTGAERASCALALNLDQNVPFLLGAFWHKKLFKQMTVEIPGVREPVISQSTFSRFAILRKTIPLQKLKTSL